jgi:hypothetical protein
VLCGMVNTFGYAGMGRGGRGHLPLGTGHVSCRFIRCMQVGSKAGYACEQEAQGMREDTQTRRHVEHKNGAKDETYPRRL